MSENINNFEFPNRANFTTDIDEIDVMKLMNAWRRGEVPTETVKLWIGVSNEEESRQLEREIEDDYNQGLIINYRLKENSHRDINLRFLEDE